MTRHRTWSFLGMLGLLGVSFVGLAGCGKAPPPEEPVAVDPAVEALAVEPLGPLEPDLGRETAILSQPWASEGSKPGSGAVPTAASAEPSPATVASDGPAEGEKAQLDMDDMGDKETSVENSAFSDDPNR